MPIDCSGVVLSLIDNVDFVGGAQKRPISCVRNSQKVVTTWTDLLRADETVTYDLEL